MSAETWFQIANTGVLPAWVILAVAPRWRLGVEVIVPVVFPALLALLYLGLAVSAIASGGAGEGDFSSLAGVMALFTSPWGVLTGWVHYLCFDLIVGAWEVRDAQRFGVPHLAVVPCLFFTLMLGPVGLLAYLVLRGAVARQVSVPVG